MDGTRKYDPEGGNTDRRNIQGMCLLIRGYLP